MPTWNSFSSKRMMFSLQNSRSLCMGLHSRAPDSTSCLYLSNELITLRLCRSPSCSESRASFRS